MVGKGMAVVFRLVALLISVVVLLGGAAHAAPFPAGTPVSSSDLTPNPTGKIAEPGDDVAHPGVTTEWWYASFMDPASKRQFVIVIFNAPMPVIGAVEMYADGVRAVDYAKVPAVGRHGGAHLDGLPGIRTDRGEISYDQDKRAYRVRVDSAVRADVWLDRGQLPGVTGVIDAHHGGQWMGWTSPVATSTVRGWVQMPGGAPVDITGWRGYHDHNWGNFTMFDQVVDGWEWGVSHEPDGGASIIGGIVRRGGQWVGSVTDVRPSGTRLCTSSTLELSGWTTTSTFALPHTITATCGPAEKHQFSKTFQLVDPVVADTGLLGMSFEAPYRTVPGSVGMFEHIRSLLARFDQVLK